MKTISIDNTRDTEKIGTSNNIYMLKADKIRIMLNDDRRYCIY